MFAELYDSIRLMSDLLWPPAAAAVCSGLHVPAHPRSLHVYVCVCVFCVQVTADLLRVKEQEKITPLNLCEHLPITSVSICVVVGLSEHRGSKGINAEKMRNKNLKKPEWKLFGYCTLYTLYHSDRAEGS